MILHKLPCARDSEGLTPREFLSNEANVAEAGNEGVCLPLFCNVSWFFGGFWFWFFLFWQLLITEAEELGYTAFNKTWAVLKVISSRQFVKCLLSSNERRGL